jgi:hypothetical protein
MSLVLSVFIVEAFLTALLWAVWVVLNLWIWQKAKATGNLLMLVGAAVLALLSLLLSFGQGIGEGSFWLTFFALIALTAGFYMSVKPMVAAQIAALGSKVRAGADAKKA